MNTTLRDSSLPVLAAVGLFVVMLFLFPHDSDGMIAVHDGVYYGLNAEKGWRGTIEPPHVLHHVLAAPTARFATAAGWSHPGIRAVVFWSALSSAVLFLVVVRAAGKRLFVGMLAATVMAASRVFLIEGATGESVPLGTLTAVLALLAAARRDSRRTTTVVLLVVALLARQDNILILPAVFIALCAKETGGSTLGRIGRPFILFFVAGVVTLGLYAAAWKLDGGAETFRDYLLRYDRKFPDHEFSVARLSEHSGALGAAFIGRFWKQGDPNIWIGPLFLILFVVGGRFLFRPSAKSALGSMIVLTLIARTAFFVWTEPKNQEWHHLTIALAALFTAHRAADASDRSRTAFRIGVCVQLALAALFIGHWLPNFHRLRERRLIEIVQMVRAENGPDVVLSSTSPSLWPTCALLGLRCERLPLPRSRALQAIAELVVKSEKPVVYLYDRFVQDGMPQSMHGPHPEAESIREAEAIAGTRVLTEKGVPYGAVFQRPR